MSSTTSFVKTIPLSRSNLHSAVEAFLRQMRALEPNEDLVGIPEGLNGKGDTLYLKVEIQKEEVKVFRLKDA